MNDLDVQLSAAKDSREEILVVTDGAFSMDGTIAQLDAICDIAKNTM